MATARPRTSAIIFWLMARPAGSSLALLMRWPVNRRCIARPIMLLALSCESWAVNALMLVLTTVILVYSSFPPPQRIRGAALETAQRECHLNLFGTGP